MTEYGNSIRIPFQALNFLLFKIAIFFFLNDFWDDPFYTDGFFHLVYCKFGNFREGFIFAKLSICEVSWKIESSRIGEIILSFTDIGKSRPCVANMSFTCKEANYKQKILSVKNNNLKWPVFKTT